MQIHLLRLAYVYLALPMALPVVFQHPPRKIVQLFQHQQDNSNTYSLSCTVVRYNIKLKFTEMF